MDFRGAGGAGEGVREAPRPLRPAGLRIEGRIAPPHEVAEGSSVEIF